MDTLQVKHSVIINLPAEEIFAYISNLENLAIWSDAVASAEKISTGEKLIGTTLRFRVGFLDRYFETTYEVVESIPGRNLTFKSISSIAPSLVCYQCKPREDFGTTFSMEETINFTGGFLGFDEKKIRNAIRNQAIVDLQNLKNILEATVPNAENNCGF